VGEEFVILFGVIGIGKTFTMVAMIECVQRFVLIIVYNKIFVV